MTRGTEVKDLNFIRYFLKERVLNSHISKNPAKLEGMKLQEHSSCDSIEVLWSTELPVTQKTQQTNSKSKM